MEYRRLGGTGLQVSVLSFGSWVTFGPQLAGSPAEECLSAAYDAGVNFFDNAEGYAQGESERIMGAAIASLGWPRHSYVLSTKLFWRLHDLPNMRNTLNRKYLFQAIDGSLERFGVDFVDLLYCHRPDPDTPIEETVWAMSDIISAGKALYWGPSEWSAEEIRTAWDIADRHHLHKPVVEEQPSTTCSGGSGSNRSTPPSTTTSAWASPPGAPWPRACCPASTSRDPRGIAGSLPGYEWLRDLLTNPDRNAKVRELQGVADELGCTLSQLSIAWCAKNPHVSTVITGASRVEQVRENMGALEVIPKLTDEVLQRITTLVG